MAALCVAVAVVLPRFLTHAPYQRLGAAISKGVVERVVRNDASVCGTNNPVAFGKLRGLLALHFGVRDSMADAHGQALASRVERQVIDRLRARFPTLAGAWPPAAR